MISSPSIFTVACPSCFAEFPVDAEKVPEGGVRAICSSCLRAFPIPGTVYAGQDTVEDLVEPGEDLVESTEEDSPPEALLEEGDDTSDATTALADPEAVESAVPAADSPEASTTEDAAAFIDLTSLASEAISEPDADSPGTQDGEAVEASLSSGAGRFGARDPHDRARRLARVLVSDIIAYYPTRYRESFSGGTLKEDFHDEIRKSWKEYVDQVGEELAESTPYFAEALNGILAKGEDVF